MNTEMQWQVQRAEKEVAQIRRELAEYARLNVKIDQPSKELKAFDASLKELEQLNEQHAEIPTNAGEVVGDLAADVRAAFTESELTLFKGRDKPLGAFREQIEKKDRDIATALASLIGAMQERWKLTVQRHELATLLQNISQRHNTSESFTAGAPGWGKPFEAMRHTVWPAFVGAFLARLAQVLPNCETTPSYDVVRTVFEKPVFIDIGHDENSRKAVKAR